MSCIEVVNVLIFCLLPVYTFGCHTAALFWRWGLFHFNRSIYLLRSSSVKTFKYLSALPLMMPYILNMRCDHERLKKVWTVKEKYHAYSCSPGCLWHSSNALIRRWILKNIIISKTVTMVRFSYNNAKDLYGNNGELYSVMPEFSFCQGFIPLMLTSEDFLEDWWEKRNQVPREAGKERVVC